jgi:membrane-associated phospholipid phosphatase
VRLAAALIAKLAFAACAGRYSLFGVESPSGHAALSVTFYGCVAALIATGRTAGRRWALCGAVGAPLLAIGASWVALEAHTTPEVVVGVSIGAASIALFNALRIRSTPLAFSPQTVVQMSPSAVVCALSVLLLAGRWSAEPIIKAICRAARRKFAFMSLNGG